MAWIEILTKPSTIIADLTAKFVTNGWILHDDVTADKKVLKTTTSPDVAHANKTMTVYVIFERKVGTPGLHEIQLTLVRTWDPVNHTGTDLSPFCLWSWYKSTGTMYGITDQMPVQIWGSINNNRAILAMMGDPTIQFDNYVISYGYLGRLIPFNDTYEDIDGNFCLSFAASNDNTADDKSKIYGDYTSNGNRTISMLMTKSNVLYQDHHVAFTTPITSMQKDAFNPSRWTGKFHLTPIYVVHGYDGYRGRLEDMVGLDRTAIVHLDELTVLNGAATDTYKYIAPKNVIGFLQDSANISYGIAIKKV